MTDSFDLRKRILDLSPRRLALLALELQEQLDRERAARREPIAVVGMACRFPGSANSPDEYWSLLADGRDAIAEVPADRWSIDDLYDPDPDAPGKVATRWGGFLDDVQRFDAGFFSISPREARSMDPQQRLLLETAWRAFEDAGIPPARWYGAKAGVFIGICNNDYLVRLLKEGAEAMDLYLSSGNAYSVAAGRLAFTLGFQGPAVAVDTACSSSLVAIHQACASLRRGESDLVVAGGVNVMSSAETTMALSRSHMMAPDGRCKTFDDSADGFVRAEGCGVLLLKRLGNALRDGDRIHAVIRGSAIGQDGRSTGLTVPNGPAQETVIRDALADAGLAPGEIDFIEAHGTGTTLGDPIEVRALGHVFGQDPERVDPLYIGSVKTNLGHLESAAGVAGVIKAILSVKAGEIPPHLHFTTPSRHIEWEGIAVTVAPEGAAWPETGRPRRAGVSSFGFSGTNAHVIVEQAPVIAERTAAAGEAGDPEAGVTGSDGTGTGEVTRAAELIPLSGYSPDARDAVTAAFAEAVDSVAGVAGLADFAHTARAGRTHFPWRRAVVAGDPAEAASALRGEAGTAVIEAPHRAGDPPELVFLFTGQGSQHPGMARVLYEDAPAFRAALDRCAAILDPVLGRSLVGLLCDEPPEGGAEAPIYETTWAQPAVVAFEYALAELWKAWGIRPAAVLGHSLGEYVAATVAGVLKLEEMLPLVAERGRLLASLPGGQRMAAIFASAELLEPLIAARPGAYIAAYNAPENTVVSGDAPVVDDLLAECARRGIEHRVLRLDQAFHSPGVEPVMDALEAAAAGVTHDEPRLPIAWNVTGHTGAGGATSGAYWRLHAREAVRFTQGVQALAEQGFRHFLEIGPHPTLSPLVQQAVEDGVVIPSLRRGGEPWREILGAAGQLYVHGAEFDWPALDAGRECRRVPIPVHPFAGERYWVEGGRELRAAAPRGTVPGAPLGAAVPIFETTLTPSQPAFLNQHRFRGTPIVPGPLFAEFGRGAAAAAGLPAALVTDLRIRGALEVPDAGVRVQTVIDQTPGETRFRVLSARSVASEEDGMAAATPLLSQTTPGDVDGGLVWVEHATGVLSGPPAVRDPVDAAPLAVPGWGLNRLEIETHLAVLRGHGFGLGPDAALYDRLEVSRPHGRATFRTPAEGTSRAISAALLVDAGLQLLGAISAATDATRARMLTAIGRIEYVGDPLTAVTATATLRPGENGAMVGDVDLLDENGQVVVRVRDATLGRVGALAAPDPAWFHELVWRPIADTSGGFGAADVEAATSAVNKAWPGLAGAAALSAYVDWLPSLRDRTAGHIWWALTRLGMPASGLLGSSDEISERLGIAPRHRRLFPRLLEVLGDAGVLRREGNHWRAVAPPPWAGADTPTGCVPIVDLVDRCGAALDRLLTGAVDPLTILFPDAAVDGTRAIYRSTPFGRAFNGAIWSAVRALAGERRADAPLRVLEIGGGSGATTEAVLAALEGREVIYTFTDVSPTLVDAARRDLPRRPGLEFRTLDIEHDPAEQAFDPAGYDLVVAANVLHATIDLSAALRNATSLLGSGGALLLLEGTRPEPWVDLTFGLTEGWWRFADAGLRSDHPLVGVDTWKALLVEAGFAEIVSLPEDGLADGAGQIVLLARRPGGAAEKDTTLTDRVHDARVSRDPAALLATLHEVAEGEGERVWIVTENAQAVGATASPDPDAAALWGLGRTFALEHPDRWGGLIDLEAGTDPVRARRQIEMALSNPSEDQVAFRNGIRHRVRLVRSALPAGAEPTIAGGNYLVTGGLGGLGLHLAQWLAEAGAARVVLVGRSADPSGWAADDPRQARLEALAALPAEIVIRSVDVAEVDGVRELMAEIDTADAPLRGIFHAAAVFDEAPLFDLTPERYDRLMRPKVLGARNLIEAVRGRDLEFIVLFSSTTALLGVAGLGSYAAANLALDALAARSRAEGVPALSINWGLWREMRLAGTAEAVRYEQSGLRTMENRSALEAMARVIGSGTANAVVAAVDWVRLKSVYEARRERPLLEELGIGGVAVAGDGAGEISASGTPGDSGSAKPLFEVLAALPMAERRQEILRAVEEETRAVLRLTSGYLDVERGFFEMGMDSLMSVELKGRLEKRFGARLPATLTFNYPTMAAVAGFLEGRVGAANDRARTGSAAVGEGPAAADIGKTRPEADRQGDAEPDTDGEMPAIVTTSADTATDPLSGGDAPRTGDGESEAKLADMLEDRLARLGLGNPS